MVYRSTTFGLGQAVKRQPSKLKRPTTMVERLLIWLI